VEFSDQVFSTDDAVLAQMFSDDGVVVDWDSLLVDLGEASLVNEVRDGLSGRISRWSSESIFLIPISNVRFNFSQHVYGGLVDSDQSSVVELSKSQQLEDLSDLWVQSVNTISKLA
jgi:hypothetical protein